MRVLEDMERGRCKGTCRSTWRRNITYALESKSNPLKLTPKERKSLKLKYKSVSKTRSARKSGNKTKKSGWNFFGL